MAGEERRGAVGKEKVDERVVAAFGGQVERSAAKDVFDINFWRISQQERTHVGKAFLH